MALSTNEMYSILCTVSNEPKALWGKMTFQHMVEHLCLAVRMSNGKLLVECYSPTEKQPTLKKILMSERPLPKNFTNPMYGENLLPLEFATIEEALSGLKQEIDDYINCFLQKPDSIYNNLIFGALNKEEWEVFHGKHFRHHLSQFGLI